MKQSPSLAAVLQRAKGVFIIPHYGKGGFIVGGQGGGGVVLAKHDGEWTSPAFYSLSGGSIGAQAGGEGGAIAMILMTQKAVNRFENSSSGWSLNGNAGLTVVNWSDKTQANTNRGDVILWTNARGLTAVSPPALPAFRRTRGPLDFRAKSAGTLPANSSAKSWGTSVSC